MWSFGKLCRGFGLVALTGVISAAIVPRLVGKRPPPLFTYWTINEFQPNIRNGGRANTFAVHPTDHNIIYVTSESGGLFKSTNGGVNWYHIDTLPCYRLFSIVLLPTDPEVVVVTTGDDFKEPGGGGVWRSTAGGGSWTQAPTPPGVTERYSAYEISAVPGTDDLYAGCDIGLLTSQDGGISWSYTNIFPGGNRAVISVLASDANRILVGGPDGIRYSTNGGGMWNVPGAGAGSVWDVHAFGRSPRSAQHAYVANGNTNLYYTEDSGATWTQIASAPGGGGGGGCGGIGFVKAKQQWLGVGLSRINLYFGNRCGVVRLRCPISGGSVDYSGAWTNLNIDHSDTRDLAFIGNTPFLLGTDGGLHKTTDGGLNWTFTGGGNAGFNALQITEVQGQYIEDLGRHDFYFGTQDNDLWSSGTDGASWTSGMCCEGFFIECLRRVVTSADSKITNVSCAGCGNYISNPLFTGVAGWANPPGNVAGNPMIVRRSYHLQGADTSGGFNAGLLSTSNHGTNWRQFASFTEDRRDIPKLGSAGGGRRSTVVYQAYRAPGWAWPGNFEINHLARIRKLATSSTATVFYPAMNGFGGLGINPTMFAWYQVYGVDKGNSNHVIAPDVVNEKMMETRDGGENWTEIPGLTSLVTNGGNLRFRNWIFPIVTAVSFCPQDPNLVMLGTAEGGVYLSRDNGATWERIPNSEGVTYATAIHWKNANDVIISTYGRGLWRLRNEIFIPRPDFEKYCRLPCFIWDFKREVFDPPFEIRWDKAMLVFEGRVMGARVEQGILKEVFVSPGSSVAFAKTDQKKSGIKVTRTRKVRGFEGIQASLKVPKEGWLIKGVIFDEANRVRGAIVGDKEMPMSGEGPDLNQRGKTKSPLDGKASMSIRTKRYDGVPVAYANEPIEIVGRGLGANAQVTILVDGRPARFLKDQGVNGLVKVSANGTFRVQLRAPRQMGLHTIVVKVGEKIVDGSMFLVKHEDEPLDKKKTGGNQRMDHSGHGH